MKYYDFKEFEGDVKKIATEIMKFNPDALVAIARGGLTLGHSLAVALDMRNLYTLNSIHYDGETKLDTLEVFNLPDLSKCAKIVLIDDIVDSGETLAEIRQILLKKYPNLEIKIATLFYKKTAVLQPDFSVREADDWIEFFWDIKV